MRIQIAVGIEVGSVQQYKNTSVSLRTLARLKRSIPDTQEEAYSAIGGES